MTPRHAPRRPSAWVRDTPRHAPRCPSAWSEKRTLETFSSEFPQNHLALKSAISVLLNPAVFQTAKSGRLKFALRLINSSGVIVVDNSLIGRNKFSIFRLWSRYTSLLISAHALSYWFFHALFSIAFFHAATCSTGKPACFQDTASAKAPSFTRSAKSSFIAASSILSP